MTQKSKRNRVRRESGISARKAKSPGVGKIRIKSRHDLFPVELLDQQFRKVKGGYGSIHVEVAPGTYIARCEVGGPAVERLVKVRSRQSVNVSFTDETIYKQPSGAPVPGSISRHEFYTEPAHDLAQRSSPDYRLGTGARLVLFATNLDFAEQPDFEGGANPVNWHGVKLRSAEGKVLLELPGDEKRNPDDRLYGRVGVSVDLNPGSYFLEWPLRDQSEELIALQPLWLTKHWIVQVFAGATGDDPLPQRDTMSIHMAAFPLSGRPHDPESARVNGAAELAFASLRTGRRQLGDDILRTLLHAKFKNPMLGLLGAYMLLEQTPANVDLFSEVLRNLQRLLGSHPDLWALQILGRKRFRDSLSEVVKIPVSISSPPMLRDGLAALDAAQWDQAHRVNLTATAKLARLRLLPEGPWTVFWQSASEKWSKPVNTSWTKDAVTAAVLVSQNDTQRAGVMAWAAANSLWGSQRKSNLPEIDVQDVAMAALATAYLARPGILRDALEPEAENAALGSALAEAMTYVHHLINRPGTEGSRRVHPEDLRWTGLSPNDVDLALTAIRTATESSDKHLIRKKSRRNHSTESNQALAQNSPNFRALSVRDLLDARDQYHYHLMNKANVVGTAIGLYLFRKDDVAAPGAKKKDQSERRFDNSAVGDASWPSVLVLVNEWIDDAHFGGGEEKHEPFEMVPKTLFLPDGRTVPVCVVKVSPVESIPSPIPKWLWPGSLLGGGFPINVSIQGRSKTATAGCLVSDGHTIYALTNRHVCGPAGTRISALLRNRQVVVGRSSAQQLTRLPFSELYPSLPMRSTYVNLEIGLVELENVNDWTSQVYGLGPIGPLLDLNDHNLSLRLIGQEVVAHGAHSGELSGRIQALFYRYKSVGGYEYVSDFLIAPAAGKASTQPGDSGTVWHLAPKLESDRPLPLAVEWGGQTFAFPTGTERLNFALATTLSNVCHLLNVELVQEHNTGVMPYWGQTGHYSIGSFAASFTGGGKLGTLINANLDRISFARGDLDTKRIRAALKDARDNGGFVPLADVPDLVWKNFPGSVAGGRDNRRSGHGRSTGPEHPTHYADIDEPRPSDGKTLRELSLADPTTNLTVRFWQAFYDECGHPSSEPTRRGLLPFRVWQFYDAMVATVQREDVADYVCAAGLLAHYIGDACQPLHGSMFADGFPQQDGENGDQRGQGIHSVYETKMIDRFATDLVTAIATKVAQLEPLPEVTSGAGAALATVELMDRSAKTLPPTDLVNAFIRAGGTNHAAERDALWENFHDETAILMADGARVLGMLWKSAWLTGNGPSIPANKIVAIEPSTLRELYENPAFVPSLTLDEIEPVLIKS